MESSTTNVLQLQKMGECSWLLIILLQCLILSLFPKHVLMATVKDRMLGQEILQFDSDESSNWSGPKRKKILLYISQESG